jgi:methylated-DNA-[protein]-cysteine S-methyltransferase
MIKRMKRLPDKLFYTVCSTTRGWVGILASNAGLLAVTLPQRTSQQAVNSLGKRVRCSYLSIDRFSELTERFQAYYSGKAAVFPDELDFSFATPFQRRVWEATRLIPYGETRSYGWVARQIGKPLAARAVGQSLGRNPFLIVVPCHRVIAGNGRLGGFGSDPEMKRTLLELEKVH